MKNILRTTCLLIFLLNSSVDSINIECIYASGDFSHSLKGPSTYRCRVNNLNLISRQDLNIGNLLGPHLSDKSNDNVIAFQVFTGTAYYCLKGVEKYFKNLKAFCYQQCHLKEIHQEDLKPFPNIIDLYLNNNEIEVIEEGLLDYNTELVLVYLVSNKITQIHSDVFDHLGKLTHLYLSSNICINKDATDSTAIKALSEQIKTQSTCQSIEFMSIDGKLKILENNLKPMNSKLFKEQLEKLKTEFKYSKFSKFSPFDDRLESLKISIYAGYCKASNQSISIQEISHEDRKYPRIEDLSSYDDKIKTMDETLADFQNKIDALSSKVSSIAEIVEQLEDKLGKMFKTVNIKVTVDV